MHSTPSLLEVGLLVYSYIVTVFNTVLKTISKHLLKLPYHLLFQSKPTSEKVGGARILDVPQQRDSHLHVLSLAGKVFPNLLGVMKAASFLLFWNQCLEKSKPSPGAWDLVLPWACWFEMVFHWCSCNYCWHLGGKFCKCCDKWQWGEDSTLFFTSSASWVTTQIIPLMSDWVLMDLLHPCSDKGSQNSLAALNCTSFLPGMENLMKLFSRWSIIEIPLDKMNGFS